MELDEFIKKSRDVAKKGPRYKHDDPRIKEYFYSAQFPTMVIHQSSHYKVVATLQFGRYCNQRREKIILEKGTVINKIADLKSKWQPTAEITQKLPPPPISSNATQDYNIMCKDVIFTANQISQKCPAFSQIIINQSAINRIYYIKKDLQLVWPLICCFFCFPIGVTCCVVGCAEMGTSDKTIILEPQRLATYGIILSFNITELVPQYVQTVPPPEFFNN